MQWTLLFFLISHTFYLAPSTTWREKPCLQHLWGQGDDLHKVAVAQFTSHRAKDTGAAWVIPRGENHRRVLIEANIRAIWPTILLRHPHDHCRHHFPFFHRSIGRSLLHRSFDNIANPGILPGRTAQDANTHDLLRPGIIGHLQARLDLNHGYSSSSSSASETPSTSSSTSAAATSSTGGVWALAVKISTSFQRLSLLKGRVSSIRTMSPMLAALVSSCALNFRVTLYVFL